MSSLTSNVHVLYQHTRAERLSEQAPSTLFSVIASLFSAAGRERLAAETSGDASDAAYAWGL